MLSRRAFLKHAIAAGVVAAVAPSLLKQAATPTMMLESTAKGRLSYEQLRNAYQQVTFGYDEPNLIVMDQRIYRIFKRLHDDPRYQNEFAFQVTEPRMFTKVDGLA